MTAPDLESIIAAVLAGHWNFSTSTDDYPRLVDRCDGCNAIVHHHGRDENQDRSYAAHQARAVLAALAEAGNVEWGVVPIPGGTNVMWKSPDKAAVDRETARFPNLRTTVTRITGPWMAVEG